MSHDRAFPKACRRECCETPIGNPHAGTCPTLQPTPGPWHYHATAGHHDFLIYAEATGRDIALVRDFNEANARLIVKAPEMRRLLARFADKMRTLAGYDYLEDEAAEARTLLAEMEGERS